MQPPSPTMRAAGALAVLAPAACAPATRQTASGAVPAAAHAPPATHTAPYTDADVRVMSGMIGHHPQAVMMAGWAPSHGASAAGRGLCERVVVGQRDEIVMMQRWLRDRHGTGPDADT